MDNTEKDIKEIQKTRSEQSLEEIEDALAFMERPRASQRVPHEIMNRMIEILKRRGAFDSETDYSGGRSILHLIYVFTLLLEKGDATDQQIRDIMFAFQESLSLGVHNESMQKIRDRLSMQRIIAPEIKVTKKSKEQKTINTTDIYFSRSKKEEKPRIRRVNPEKRKTRRESRTLSEAQRAKQAEQMKYVVKPMKTQMSKPKEKRKQKTKKGWCWENFKTLAQQLNYDDTTLSFLKELVEGAPTLRDKGTNLKVAVENWSGDNTEKVLNQWLEEGVLVEITKKGEVPAALGAVPKKDGTIRPILDCRPINAQTELWPTELNTPRYFPLIPHFAAVIDITSGYTHIPLHEDWLEVTVVEVNNKRYGAKRLPFGSSVAAQMFTMVLQVIVEKLRSEGIFVLQYVDDLLIGGETMEETKTSLKRTLELLSFVGFKVKKEKIQEPSNTIEYLGFTLDLQKRKIRLPEDKRENMLKKLKTKDFSLGSLLSLQGKLQSASLISQTYRKLSLELGNRIAREMHLKNFDSLEQFVQKHRNTILHIDETWMNQAISFLEQQVEGDLSPRVVTAAVATDASLRAEGIVLDNGVNQKTRTFKVNTKQNIAFLELEALYKALQEFPDDALNGCWVWLIDNQTALSAFRRQKSTNKKMSRLSDLIWAKAELLNCKIIPLYIPTNWNTIADMLSRENIVNMENGGIFASINLCPEVFKIPDYVHETFSIVRKCPRMLNRTNRSLQGKSRSLRRVARRYKTASASGEFPRIITEEMLTDDLEHTPSERLLEEPEHARGAIGYDSVLYFAEVERIGKGIAYKQSAENIILDLTLRAMRFNTEVFVTGAPVETWLPWRYYVAVEGKEPQHFYIPGPDMVHLLSEKQEEQGQLDVEGIEELTGAFEWKMIKGSVSPESLKQYSATYEKYLNYYDKTVGEIPEKPNLESEKVLHKFINREGEEVRANGGYKRGMDRLRQQYAAVLFFWKGMGWKASQNFNTLMKATCRYHERLRKAKNPHIKDNVGITKEQLFAFLEYMDQEGTAVEIQDTAMVLYYTCSRKNDIHQGITKVFEEEDEIIKVAVHAGKNENSKVIPISKSELEKHEITRDFYNRLKENKVMILNSDTEKRKTLTQALATTMSSWTKKAALSSHISPHALRRGRARDLYQETNDIEVVRKAGAWKSQQSAQQYVQCTIIEDSGRILASNIPKSSSSKTSNYTKPQRDGLT
eukprot:TRINITY_DN3174_c1_g1_i18.p1 TRINITY_DN3174_c1_g1~~TRINITY_DN3174_c1_g1_i18.p1  ORF type:complete len:1210 (+),score=69.08 TRINITY_DN3174_c1_g1_i18:74-3703(+)